MKKRIINSTTKFLFIKNIIGFHVQKSLTNNRLNNVQSQIMRINQKIKYSFAKNVSSPMFQKKVKVQQKIVNQTQQIVNKPQKQLIEPKSQNNSIYTFTNLEVDLQTYQKFLDIHNTHTKKAHEKLFKNQILLISKIIQKNQENLILKFLQANITKRLTNQLTLPSIIEYYRKKWQSENESDYFKTQSINNKLQLVTIMAQYGQFGLFERLLQKLNSKFNVKEQNNGQYLFEVIKNFSQSDSMIFVYNYLMYKKQLPQSFMGKFKQFQPCINKLNNEKHFQVKRFFTKYSKMYYKGIDQLNSNQQQQKQSTKSSDRSLLQRDIECFLKVMNYPLIKRQILIDGYMVDFVIDGVKSNKNKKINFNYPTVFEVMGSHHYTINGNFRSKDIKKLIVLGSIYRKQKYNVKIVHHNDFNKSRGHRNKMEYIRYLIQQHNGINWFPKNQGFDANWQLKQGYDEFK